MSEGIPPLLVLAVALVVVAALVALGWLVYRYETEVWEGGGGE